MQCLEHHSVPLFLFRTPSGHRCTPPPREGTPWAMALFLKLIFTPQSTFPTGCFKAFVSLWMQTDSLQLGTALSSQHPLCERGEERKRGKDWAPWWGPIRHTWLPVVHYNCELMVSINTSKNEEFYHLYFLLETLQTGMCVCIYIRVRICVYIYGKNTYIYGNDVVR